MAAIFSMWATARVLSKPVQSPLCSFYSSALVRYVALLTRSGVGHIYYRQVARYRPVPQHRLLAYLGISVTSHLSASRTD